MSAEEVCDEAEDGLAWIACRTEAGKGCPGQHDSRDVGNITEVADSVEGGAKVEPRDGDVCCAACGAVQRRR